MKLSIISNPINLNYVSIVDEDGYFVLNKKGKILLTNYNIAESIIQRQAAGKSVIMAHGTSIYMFDYVNRSFYKEESGKKVYVDYYSIH